jgi:hypothetical protein
MKEEDVEEVSLRRFLLGQLNEDERERVEERFTTDRDFRELVLLVEDELVEAYLDGSLPKAEKELFVEHLLSTPEQRRKIRIAGSLRSYLVAGEPASPAVPAREAREPASVGGGISHGGFLFNRTALLAASLALLLALVFGSVWLFGVQRQRNQLAEVRRALEQLNRLPIPDGSIGVFLSPLAVRGGGAKNTLPSPNDGSVAHLWLLLVKDEYQSYQVVFWKEGDAERFTLGGLRAEATPSGKAIPVRLPAGLLRPGTYVFKLNGVTADGRTEEVGEYDFRVTP